MCFYEELYSKLCLQLQAAKLVSSDAKEHFYTLLSSRDSCHNSQNPFSSDLQV